MLLEDGNPSNDYMMNFEIIIDDVTDAPPYFTSRFAERVKEDVPVVINTFLLWICVYGTF